MLALSVLYTYYHSLQISEIAVLPFVNLDIKLSQADAFEVHNITIRCGYFAPK
jgi:hypothetical protein